MSELAASNNSVLQDENGDYPDWVEIHNPTAQTVDVGGCYLTDDPFELDKWRFPRADIAPEGFLVVFCSDKDRAVAGSELHANFKLASLGDYLALVAPNGSSVIWEYAPKYPPQVEDYSYGLRMDATFSRLVGAGSAVRARVPTSADSGAAASLAWTQVGYADGSWKSGTIGVGYDRSSDYRPLIGTDLRSEMDGVNASAWIRIPFDVPDAASMETLVLRVKYDDGFIAYLNGTRVADANAPGSVGDWNEDATADHPDDRSQIFEEWSFPNGGLLQSGPNVLAIHGLNNGTTSSDFLIYPELDARGRGSLDATVRQYFHVPTPGAGNIPGYPEVSPKPGFSLESRLFEGSLTIELLVVPQTATIRYTLDRSEPTETSAAYTAPIRITAPTTIRARSFMPDKAPSPIASETYLTMDAALRTRSSAIPLIVVDTLGTSIPPTNATYFAPGYMAIYDRQSNGRSSLANAADLLTRIGIRVRGSTSANEPKKPYRVEFWDAADQDEDHEVFGLPADSDWILYPAYNFDHTHLRCPLIYELSNQVGRYAARSQFVEIYLNENGGPIGAADYIGIYAFMEKLKRGGDRIDVERLDPSAVAEPDIMGGYVFKKDRPDPDGSGGFTAGGITDIQWVYPDYIETTSPQRTWIQSHLSTVFTTTNFWDYIDPLSAIDHHILNAMPKNVDAFRLSGYFFKGRYRKVEFGPIWDFDRSMDSTDGRDNAFNTWEGTGDSSLYFSYDNRTPYWYRWLQDPEFLQLWKDRWHELRQGPLSTGQSTGLPNNIGGVIDRMSQEIQEAVPRDIARWGRTSNWLGEVNYLKSWLTSRCAWIDSQWPAPPRLSLPGGDVAPGTVVEVTGGNTLYVTTDGTDPRLPGGGVALEAAVYGGPIAIEENSRIVARVRVAGTNWSAPAAATYVIETPPIVITEMMFHPLDPEPDSIFDADDFEFIEILNIGEEPISLYGARLAAGIDFTFGRFVSGEEPTLFPGERVVVVSNLVAFGLRYDTTNMLIAGQYTGRLSNGGDQVVLEGPVREPIHSFEYSDLWYPETDGDGYSLAILDPLSPLSDWAEAESWAPSSILGGTPGADDSGIVNPGGRQLVGDANQDGVLDISDPLSLLLRLFGGLSRALPCEGTDVDDGGNKTIFDVDADGAVDVTDAIVLLRYLFQEGPPPALGTGCVRIEGCPTACIR